MPRVLQVCEGLGPLHGGPGIDIPNYCRALARLGWSVHLATAYSSEADRLAALSAKNSAAEFTVSAFSCKWALRWRFSPRLARWLVRNIAGFDIVHLNSVYSFPVLFAATVARTRGVPYVLTPHGTLANVQRRVSAGKKAVYNALAARSVLNHAAAIIYSARQEHDDALPLRLTSPAALVPNGIALDQFASLPARGAFRAKFFGGSDDPLILYLGRLNAKKGLDILIDAFARIVQADSSILLALAGPGDPPSYRDTVQSWLRERNVAHRVAMPGVLTGEGKLAAFADSDLFVSPSRGENFGSAIFEALACGLPVVVSEDVAAAQEIASSNAGASVKLDPAALASAVSALLRNPARRAEMAGNARRLAERYTSERTAGELLALYRNVVGAVPPERWAINRPKPLVA